MLRSLRQERWDDAATKARQQQSVQLIGPNLPPGAVMQVQWRDAPILVIESVALRHLGRTQEAGAALDKASGLLEQAEKEWASDRDSMEWETIVTLRVLMREAMATQGTNQPVGSPPL